MSPGIHYLLINRHLKARRENLAARLLGTVPRALGDGAHAAAFLRGRKQVLKVVDARVKAALWYAEFVRRQNGPNWPRALRVRWMPKHVAL